MLDPTTIEIVDGLGDSFDVTDVDEFSDPNLGGDRTRLSTLALLLSPTDVTLQATEDIIVNASLQPSPGLSLAAEAGRDIIVNRLINTTDANVRLEAGQDIIFSNALGTIFSDGGQVSLTAGNNVLLENGAVIDTSVLFGSSPQSGSITLNTTSLEMRSGGQLITNNRSGINNGGNITIRASGPISLEGPSTGILSGIDPGFTGQGGTIDIQAQSLSLLDGAQIQTLLALDLFGFGGASGNAGNIKISAPDFVRIDGTSANGFSSGLFASSERGAIGDAGTITVETGAFTVSGGALVNTASFNSGNGGEISITSNSFAAVGGGQLLSLSLLGDGGDVVVDSQGDISLSGSDPDYLNRVATFDADVVNNPSASSGIFPNSLNNGNTGDVLLKAKGQISLLDSAFITSTTFGSGNAGNITLEAGQAISLSQQSSLSSRVEQGATGAGGLIVLQAPQLSLSNGGAVSVSTSGTGNAGNIAIAADDILLTSDGSLLALVNQPGSGQGGRIKIESQRLSLVNGGFISAATFGSGPGGEVDITASASLNLSGALENSGIVTDTTGSGTAGSIRINAGQLIAESGSNISTSTSDSGNAGNLILNIDGDVAVSGLSTITTQVNALATGRGGTMTINSNDFSIQDGARVVSGTLGFGAAGDLNLTATGDVSLAGANSLLSTQAQSTGDAGALNLQARTLTVRDGTQVATGTFADGNGGNLTVKADEISLAGQGSSLVTQTNGTGSAGNLTIAADTLSLSDRANLSLRSRGTGRAGNLDVEAQLLSLNQSEIVTESEIGNGGDINLNIQTALAPSNGSLISTTAGNSQNPGSGGNIEIDVPFVIGLLDENSDIVANAFNGSGGNITINADAILNFQRQDESNINTLRANTSNDISASATLGTPGILDLAGLNIDPSQGTNTLPTNLLAPADQVSRRCAAERVAGTGQGEFYITGRSGLPIRPGDAPTSRYSTGTITTTSDVQKLTATSPEASNPTLTEAGSWQHDRQGNIQLIASSLPLEVESTVHCKQSSPAALSPVNSES